MHFHVIIVHLRRSFSLAVQVEGQPGIAFLDCFLFVFGFLLVSVFLSSVFSVHFGTLWQSDQENHGLITDGIHWTGLCWGVGDLPFEPAKFSQR